MVDDKAKEVPQKQRNADPATIKCMVHRLNCDESNAKIPITVNAVGRMNGKKVFAPGEVVNLTQAQYNNLVDAVDEPEILIQEESGIYDSSDPMKAAQSRYPGFKIIKNPETGFITATKRDPHYSIERVVKGGGFQ